MQKQLLRCGCVLFMFIFLTAVPAALAVTNLVTWVQIGTFPMQKYYWKPTNVVITVGDTVMWTNLGNIHSLEPSPTNAPEQFCGTGTNVISNCFVTFLTPGTFRYDCFQHLPTMTGSVVVLAPPVVAITNPPNNSIFPTHADVQVFAQASDLDGAVTNVQFLNNGVSFSTNTVAPYTVTLSNVAPGYYNLRARAVDNSALVTTSALVTVRVAPPPVMAASRGSNGPLQFSFNTVTGVSYVVEASPIVTNFLPVVTNAGSGGAQQFIQSNPPPAQRFFRLRLQ